MSSSGHRRDPAGDLDAVEARPRRPSPGTPAARPWAQAISSSVPPRQDRTPCAREQRQLRRQRRGRGRRCPSRTSRRRCAPRPPPGPTRSIPRSCPCRARGSARRPGLALRSGRLRNVGSITLPILHVSSTFRQSVRGRDAGPSGGRPWSRSSSTGELDELAAPPAVPSGAAGEGRDRAGQRGPRRRQLGRTARATTAPWCRSAAPARRTAGAAGQVIACGEALLPAFVAAGPLRRRYRRGPDQRQRPGRDGRRPAGDRRHDRRQRRARPRGAARHAGRLRAGTTSPWSAGT